MAEIELWRGRRGTKGDDEYGVNPSDCIILDAPNHGAFGYIIVRMDREQKDRMELLQRAKLAVNAPVMLQALEEIADTLCGDKCGQIAREAIARARGGI